MNTLHPEIQAALDSGKTPAHAVVDGDFYNDTLEVLASRGWKKVKRLEFKDPSIKGVRYKSFDHVLVDVVKADFLGLFTSVAFKFEHFA